MGLFFESLPFASLSCGIELRIFPHDTHLFPSWSLDIYVKYVPELVRRVVGKLNFGVVESCHFLSCLGYLPPFRGFFFFFF